MGSRDVAVLAQALAEMLRSRVRRPTDRPPEGGTGRLAEELLASLRGQERVEEAIRDLRADPADPDALAALRLQIRKVLEQEPDLVQRLRALLEAYEKELAKHLLEGLPLDDLCRRWKVRELAVFGSALREDFSSQSDLDLLVEFDEDAEWSLLDHIRLQQELEALLGRKVDLITKRALEQSRNRRFREEVLRTARTIFSRERGSCEAPFQ